MAVKPTDSGQDQPDKQIEPAEKQDGDNQPGQIPILPDRAEIAPVSVFGVVGYAKGQWRPARDPS